MYKHPANVKISDKALPIALATIVVVAIVAIGAAMLFTHNTVSAQAPPAASAIPAGPAPAPAAPGSSFDQRLAQRKAERNAIVSPRDQQRLVNVCVTAQSKLRSLQQKTTPTVTSRAKTNQLIDAKIWIMIGKLKLAEKDTFQLEKQRAELAEKISAYQQTTQSYTQALDDTVAVNCKADLVGFKALLDTARLYRIQLRDQSTGIRDYLNNDIKPTLSTFASDLQVKPSTEEGR